jgi:hypothetical protein
MVERMPDIGVASQSQNTGFLGFDKVPFSFLRAQFTEQVQKLTQDESSIESLVEALEKFVWHLCILNRINEEFGITPLGMYPFRCYSIDFSRH